jgi:hypothetical protein
VVSGWRVAKAESGWFPANSSSPFTGSTKYVPGSPVGADVAVAVGVGSAVGVGAGVDCDSD